MGDTTKTENTSKINPLKGLKAEFKKVMWPDRETVQKQTIAVVSVAVALGLIIAALDLVMMIGIERLLTLVG